MKYKSRLLRLFLLALVLLCTAGIYIYSQYNKKQTDLTKTEAAFALNAESLIKEFASNSNAADHKYVNKVIELEGNVQSVDKDEGGLVTVIVASPTEPSTSIRCSIDSSFSSEAVKLVIPHQPIHLKGIITGYNSDELLGSDIILNRCVIIH